MKTKIFKSVAIVAFSVLTLSLSAQNVKKANYNRFTSNKLWASAETNHIFSALNEELSLQLMNLEKFLKYNPKVDAVHYADPEVFETFQAVTLELEKEVRYRPETSLVNVMDNLAAINEATNELKSQVKFNPSESMVQEMDTQADFAEVLTELSKDVKYQPSKME